MANANVGSAQRGLAAHFTKLDELSAAAVVARGLSRTKASHQWHSGSCVSGGFLSAQNNAVSVLYEPSGRPLDCYPNVAGRIQQHGVRAVLGWQVAPSSLISAQTVGRVELETHCVWPRLDGCLVEITPQPHPQHLFAPSDMVKDRTRAVIVATVEDEIPRLYNMKRIERAPYINVARNSLA